MNQRRRIMRNTSVLGLALVATLVAPFLMAPALAAEEGSPFVGEWTATAVAPTGNVSETVKVVKTAAGYAITAKPDREPTSC
jgi:hypothetical protein